MPVECAAARQTDEVETEQLGKIDLPTSRSRWPAGTISTSRSLGAYLALRGLG